MKLPMRFKMEDFGSYAQLTGGPDIAAVSCKRTGGHAVRPEQRAHAEGLITRKIYRELVGDWEDYLHELEVLVQREMRSMEACKRASELVATLRSVLSLEEDSS